MSDEEADVPKSEKSGLPGWIMTFADLMSLLMCFFVLLLSFSEMDLKKFKQVAGSMNHAFGIQRLVKADAPPRGTSIVAQEFSPGRPKPTPINEVRQSTTDELQDKLKIERTAVDSAEGMAESIAAELIEDIANGKVEVEAKDGRIVVRILEKGSFDSGSAILKASFVPVIAHIAKMLETTPGKVSVAGYTDNVPIQTDIFRSNWELSAVRAVSVGQEILKNIKLDEQRFVMQGFGANKPIAPNDTYANRAKNRRVEIVITQVEEEEEPLGQIIQEVDDIKPDLEGLPQLDDTEATFPPATEFSATGENYLQETGDLGVFDANALANYELKDVEQSQNPPDEIEIKEGLKLESEQPVPLKVEQLMPTKTSN